MSTTAMGGQGKASGTEYTVTRNSVAYKSSSFRKERKKHTE